MTAHEAHDLESAGSAQGDKSRGTQMGMSTFEGSRRMLGPGQPSIKFSSTAKPWKTPYERALHRVRCRILPTSDKLPRDFFITHRTRSISHRRASSLALSVSLYRCGRHKRSRTCTGGRPTRRLDVLTRLRPRTTNFPIAGPFPCPRSTSCRRRLLFRTGSNTPAKQVTDFFKPLRKILRWRAQQRNPTNK